MNGVSIHKRPKLVGKRKSVGHWEGDLVTGSGNSHIATLVDRKTRFTLILKLKGKDAESVNGALVNAFNRLPATMKKSLTWDRGMELAKHAEFTLATNVPVYFCDPQSPWQRGTNENTNSLIRQYFPKKTCLAQHSQDVLDQVAGQLNNRPLKTLKFKTPEGYDRKERCADRLNLHPHPHVVWVVLTNNRLIVMPPLRVLKYGVEGGILIQIADKCV